MGCSPWRTSTSGDGRMAGERPETGLVISYRFLWPHEHAAGGTEGRKACPACVVVPLTAKGDQVVLFPLTTRQPDAGRLALPVPETERRRLRLRGAGPSWILLDQGNTDVLPGSFHVEPISYAPPVHAYGRFSEAFMRQVLQLLAGAIRERRLRLVRRID